MKKIKIDWINHCVSFVSALLGIFIAFQLDDWKNQANENKEIQIAITSIKSELNENLLILKEETESISIWTDYMEFVIDHSVLNERNHLIHPYLKPNQIVATKNELNKIKGKWFADIIELKKLNDSLTLYSNVSIISFYPYRAIKTDNWEAAKETGNLNKVDYQLISKLTFIYGWLNKDFSMNNDLIFDLNDDNQSQKIQNKLREFKRIGKIYRLKLQILETNLSQIKWNK